MGFRLLLVGVVASLGLDLPSPERLETWCRSGTSWLSAGLDDWNTWTPTAEEMCQLDDAFPAGLEVFAADDAEFNAVMDDVVAQFESERITAEKLHRSLALARRAAVHRHRHCKAIEDVTPKHARPAVVVFEPIVVPEDLYEGIAFELNRFGEGIEEPALPAEAPVVEEAPAIAAESAPPTPPTEIVEVEIEEAPVVVAASAPAPRVNRLATALRLTGEALEAWATLLEGPAVVSLRP